MSIKDILVHIDASDSCANRTEAAARLARTFDAQLIGFFPHPDVELKGYTESPMPRDVLEAERAAISRRVAQAEQRFVKLTAALGVRAQWRAECGDPVALLKLHAHYADLVVCGQEGSDVKRWPSQAIVEPVIMECARPVLVVPYIGALQPIGQRVYLAWDGSREAVRAANDAMPLLEKAGSVKVIAINPQRDDDAHGEIPCADMCLHLARHGVNAEALSVHSQDIDFGEVLLSRAFDDSIDLIVMGAYGHSRLKEFVLGGVTRTMLQHMTVPVLMSH